MSMIRFCKVAILPVASLLVVAPAKAGPIVGFSPYAPPTVRVHCFGEYDGFWHWNICASAQFPCHWPRIGWRRPEFFMPHNCLPPDERRAF
jgi:hypothetical protein